VLDANGVSTLTPMSPSSPVSAGEILFVQPGRTATTGQVTVLGAVSRPSTYALSPNSSAGDFIRSTQDLLSSAYTLFSLIVRRDPASNALVLRPISLAAAISHRPTPSLQSGDKVFVLTNTEVRALARQASNSLNMPFDASKQSGVQTPEEIAIGRASRAAARAELEQGGRTSTGNLPSDNFQARPLPDDRREAGQEFEQQNNQQLFPYPQGQSMGINRRSGQMQTTPPQFMGAPSQAMGMPNGGQGNETQNSPAVPPLSPQVQFIAPDDDLVVIEKMALRMGVPSAALIRAARDNLVWVLDDVVNPGPYLAASKTVLSELLSTAGGVTQRADLSSVEVSSTVFNQVSGSSQTTRADYNLQTVAPATIGIMPQDVVRVHEVPSVREQGTVTVLGQVNYPGTFNINRSERLSSLLRRAGGLTDVAYPYGAVFTRETVKEEERKGNERAARQIEDQIASLSTSGSNNPATSQAISYLVSMAQQVRNAPVVGRVTVTVDPAVLAVKPQLDIVLQPGDTIFIPKRPSSVTVSGEVLNPGSLQYRAGMSVQDYIDLAGGTTQTAEDDRTFVIRPDGSAMPARSNWLSFSDVSVPPGSTIVVPRDLRPFEWTTFLRDTSQIFSQLAIAAASLSVIRTGN
jgi:protein involved in polysaccharide export with SLBB domain